MSSQDTINAWGRAHYPDAPEGDFRIECGATDGGCPTCGGGPEPYVRIAVGWTEVDRIEDVDLGALLRELLEFRA